MNRKPIKPILGEKYYCISYRAWEDRFVVDEFSWSKDYYQREMLENQMVFQTDEDAQYECDQRNFLLVDHGYKYEYR